MPRPKQYSFAVDLEIVRNNLEIRFTNAARKYFKHNKRSLVRKLNNKELPLYMEGVKNVVDEIQSKFIEAIRSNMECKIMKYKIKTDKNNKEKVDEIINKFNDDYRQHIVTRIKIGQIQKQFLSDCDDIVCYTSSDWDHENK